MKLIQVIVLFGLMWSLPNLGEGAPLPVTADEDFQVALFAGEGLGGVPVDLDWDPQGTVWVTIDAESGGGIYTLSDVDGNGVFEERMAYFRGEATSMVFDRSGVLAAVERRISFIGPGGKEQPLFSGFVAGRDPVEIRLVRRGLDGWIYATIDYSGSVPVGINGRGGQSFAPIDGGIFRFQADGTRIEAVSSVRGRVRSLDFTWDGDLFFSSERHINQVMLTQEEMRRGRLPLVSSSVALGDHRRDYPSWEAGGESLGGVRPGPGGGVIYEGGAWPQKFNGNYFVAEPSLHSVHEDIVNEDEGRSDYLVIERTGRDFLRGDSSFWPSDIRVGPDGALYVLDLYAPVRAHGRIWRVQHRSARALQLPDFVAEGDSGLMRALSHSARWVRATAQRLLAEKGGAAVTKILRGVGRTARLSPFRVHALWTVHQLDGMDAAPLVASLAHPQWGVQKNALRILETRSDLLTTDVTERVRELLDSPSRRVRMRAMSVLSQASVSDALIKDVVDYVADERQNWGKSLAVGVAQQAPMEFARLLVDSRKAQSFREFVPGLVQQIIQKEGEKGVAELIELVAKRSPNKDWLKQSILATVQPHLQGGFTPRWSESFEDAMEVLLDSRSRRLRVAALPLAFHYPSKNRLISAGEDTLDGILRELARSDISDEDTERLLSGLSMVWKLESRMVDRLGDFLRSDADNEVKAKAIVNLGKIPGDRVSAILLGVYSDLPVRLRRLVLHTLLSRKNWTTALVRAIGADQIKGRDLGMVGLDRLRNHTDEAASRMGKIFSRGRSPSGSVELQLSRLRPIMGSPADVENGARAFRTHCADCHLQRGRDPLLGPSIQGMRSRDPMELLAHVIDPNQRLAERYKAHSLVTSGGEDYYGIVLRQDRERVILQDLYQTVEVKRSDVRLLRSFEHSYMPTGLAELGATNLRDILAYLRGEPAQKYRLVDLSDVATVDSRRGLYHPKAPILGFASVGRVEVAGKPYRLIDPEGAFGGRNIVMLRGTEGIAREFPVRVLVPVGAETEALHFLGGVAGWGYPYGSQKDQNVPSAKLILSYEGGKKEEVVWRNGEQVADVGTLVDVPESRLVERLLHHGHLRSLSVKPSIAGKLISIELASFENHTAPIFAALTIELKE